MRTVSVGLQADIDDGATTLARLWHVTRIDGTELFFTDLDRPIVFDGDTYRSDVSFTTSAIFTSRSMASSQSVTITSLMDVLGFSEDDLRARKYDGAVGVVMLINYEDTSHGVMTLFRGKFGQIKLVKKSNRVIIQMDPEGASSRGIGGEVYSRTCRNNFGDANCGFDLDGAKVAFTVTAATDLTFGAAELNQADDNWIGGKVKWLTGDNAGTYSTIRTSALADTSISVVEEPLHAIAVGDTGEAFLGCDKIITAGCTLHDRVRFFRGEPTVPPQDSLPLRRVVTGASLG